ncbi:hypothetical protein SAMN05421774_10722 [Gemmobacter megaterium]|uniref:Secreted protein n=1 Tax=Gemmobacter megaterium TaxID=1086013 RepID=A0A1N7Q2V3_9RHOB|nr:hypothetical protein [Gemmobacter megaterium]GGE22519.1 hypothetical protein GCM10011345_30540 [Gemmobacter megaterium]SIT17182.1 hypothetical protein SAMN05421774_10722 [Gemmobacter megaterium]
MTLFRPATRKIVSALGAAAIAMGAMTATALPARANSDDVMKVIAGVAAIAIIGSALNDSNRHRQPAPVMRPEPPRPHPGWRPAPPPRHGWHHPQPPRPPVVQYRPHPCGPYGCARAGHGQPPRHGWKDPRPYRPSR